MLQQEFVSNENKEIKQQELSPRGQRLDPNLIEYFGYFKEFNKRDWLIYISWVGMMLGLGLAVTTFLAAGTLIGGAPFPAFVWLIPAGILTFTFAISLDNVAHTAVYKDWISDAELMVHKFSTASGIFSVFTLMAGYSFPEVMRIPIYVFAALSFLYSLIDEAMHWIRYADGGSGLIEVMMHFLILVGHTTMVLTWILWYETGYSGALEGLAVFGM